MLDLYALYSFLKRLTTPYEKWPAFKLGIIDKDGQIIKKQRNTIEERNAFGPWDRTVLRIKNMLDKLPAGKTRLGSYAAALYLMREGVTVDSDLSESQIETLQEEITNSVGAGGVAGLGATPDDMPPRPKIIQQAIARRKAIQESEKATSLVDQRKEKKHPRKTIRVTTSGKDDGE